jgi:hypothetical protein
LIASKSASRSLPVASPERARTIRQRQHAQTSNKLRIFALIVDAKDASAVAFYERHDFRRFASKPASLFLPIATALKAL